MAQTENKKGLSLGLGVGYTNYQTIAPEGFVQWNTNIAGRAFEPKAGISYQAFDAEYNGIEGLKSGGVGLFAEAVIFPFYKYFYCGVRWDFITINKLSDSALKKMGSSYSSNTFSGTDFYGIAGIDISVFKWLNFRLYGMPGVQQYKISDGTLSSGDYVTDGTVQEEHLNFVYRVNIGLVVRLK